MNEPRVARRYPPFALLAGHVVKFLRVPEVTGYLLAGVLLGPAGAGLVSHEVLESLQVFSEVALGLILFAIGSVFELTRFRRIGRGRSRCSRPPSRSSPRHW